MNKRDLKRRKIMRTRCEVTFSPRQFAQLKLAAESASQSLAAYIRGKALGEGRNVSVLDAETRRMLLSELTKCAEAVRSISRKHRDSPAIGFFDESFREMRQEFARLYNLIVSSWR